METIFKWNTGYSADSVEWCPIPEYCDVLVCGTYQLLKDQTDDKTEKQTKVGRIYLFVFQENAPDLKPVQTIEMSAILDQKWCHQEIGGFPTLAVATSEGSLQIFNLKRNSSKTELTFVMKYLFQDGALALSLDWSNNKIRSNAPSIVVSDSKGMVTVLVLKDDKLTKIGEWNAHGFEAWIAAFNCWDTNIFYSGGDDCVFKSFDSRVPETAVSTNRTHTAGVTSLHCSPHTEHQLASGSYDETVRVWDARSLRRPTSEAGAGGGVWRLKWHPRHPTLLLAACMHGGVRLLRLDTGLSVVHEYGEHESIAYGADWRHGGDLVATCSFYDCAMHVSRVSL